MQAVRSLSCCLVPCSQDISEKWQDIARAPSPVLHEANTLPEAPTGFCLVALTEDELAENSLPATIQRLFWPQAQV